MLFFSTKQSEMSENLQYKPHKKTNDNIAFNSDNKLKMRTLFLPSTQGNMRFNLDLGKYTLF